MAEANQGSPDGDRLSEREDDRAFIGAARAEARRPTPGDARAAAAEQRQVDTEVMHTRIERLRRDIDGKR